MAVNCETHRKPSRTIRIRPGASPEERAGGGGAGARPGALLLGVGADGGEEGEDGVAEGGDGGAEVPLPGPRPLRPCQLREVERHRRREVRLGRGDTHPPWEGGGAYFNHPTGGRGRGTGPIQGTCEEGIA